MLKQITDQYYENQEQVKHLTKELELVEDKLVKTQEELQEKEDKINKMEEMAVLKEVHYACFLIKLICLLLCCVHKLNSIFVLLFYITFISILTIKPVEKKIQ